MAKFDQQSFLEKLRSHTLDIMIISTAVCLFFYLIRNKQELKKSVESDVKCEIKSVTDVKQIHTIDTLNNKIR